MIELSKIKCIIWDLDETLWNGVLQENSNVVISKKIIELLNISSATGIIHSICSKNNDVLAAEMINRLSVEKYFVFNSIEYSPKGLRLREQINALKLKPENVLFIDDEISNLKEVSYYNSEIMVSQPFIVDELLQYYRLLYEQGIRSDRRNQYKKMELVYNISKKFSTNEEFLLDSNIRVEIKEDIISVFERIYELCSRTNQLNFTKRRSDKTQLYKEIIESDESGYVEVTDKYGDYGIVGYFVITRGKLIHFLFSCRIMNMGIEQYIYKKIGRPAIEIKGEVASELESIDSYWINRGEDNYSNKIIKKNKKRILLKGSCDLRRMRIYMPDDIKYEVPYVSFGKNIVYQTGIPTMAMCLKYSKTDIRNMIQDMPFFSMEYYSTSLFEDSFDVVVLSTISLANLGVYINKANGFFLSMGIPSEPMHLNEHENKYHAGGKYANGFNNSESMFENLRNQYDYIFYEYRDKYLEQHLSDVIKNIHAKKKILILGNEELYREEKTQAGMYFSKANRIIEKVADKYDCECVNLSELIDSDENVINHFNHFSSIVYYKLAKKLCGIFEDGEENYE